MNFEPDATHDSIHDSIHDSVHDRVHNRVHNRTILTTLHFGQANILKDVSFKLFFSYPFTKMSLIWEAGQKRPDDEKKIIADSLPPGYDCKVTFYELSKKADHEIESDFKVIVKVKLGDCTSESVDTFLQDLYAHTNTSYNKFRADFTKDPNDDGTFDPKHNVLYSGLRKCQHKVQKRVSPVTHELRKDKIKDKNSECSAKLRFSLKNHEHHESCEEYSLELELTNKHNHVIKASDAMRFHPVSPDTKRKYLELFLENLTAMEAYHKYRSNLSEGEEILNIKTGGDRSINPEKSWVFREHAKFHSARFGSFNSADTYELAKQRISDYNSSKGKELSKIVMLPNGDYIVVIIDELMLRCHQHIPQSGDIIHVDSTGNVDRIDSKVTNIVCPTPAGAAPLGMIITSCETEAVMTQAFKIYKELLPSYAFYGKGESGPENIITDDSDSERKSLASVWPQSRLLLCTFHVLQATWRWLWASQHRIELKERPHLLKLLRGLMYASTENEFIELRDNLEADPVLENYENYKQYLEKLLQRHELWALFVRMKENMSTHGNNTNNFVEASFRVLKEHIFHRRKSYNLVELLDVIIAAGSNFYKQKFIDIGNNRFISYSERYKGDKVFIRKEAITEVDNGRFYVESQSTQGAYYEVDMKTGFCSCYIGRTRAPCKHKNSIHHHFGIAEFSVLPTQSPAQRAKWLFIATGVEVDASWCRGLRDTQGADDAVRDNTEPLAETQPNIEEDEESNLPDISENENIQNEDIDLEREDDDEMENGSDNEEWEDFEIDYNTTVDNLRKVAKEKFRNKDVTFIKGIRNFIRRLGDSVSNDKILEKNLFTFGLQTHDSVVSGRKRKLSSRIPVQPAALTRRVHKHGGKGASTKGRRPKASAHRSLRSNNDEDPENVRQTLPKKKKKVNRKVHSLSKSVENNVSSSRKH